LIFVSAASTLSGCGKKGPPLPPLVRQPAAPADLTAARRGDEVVLQFVVPFTNTDGTRPANVSRVDVFGISGTAAVPDDQIVKLGARVASVPVKSPRDPNRTIDPGESAEDAEPLSGDGLDQGARATVTEPLTNIGIVPAPEQDAIPTRTYAVVSIDTRGRLGPMSGRATVPLIPAPAAPSMPAVTYDETSVTLEWPAVEKASGYHVYETRLRSPDSEASSGAAGTDTRMTSEPVAETTFTASGVEWDVKRCYAVRAVAAAGELAVESGASPPACVTFADTFAPAAPTDLRGVASEGSISLIWEPNGEKDLAGYLVLRGTPGNTLEPIMLSPIKETVFNDGVPAGVRYVYAIAAVDSAGNRSAESNRFEDAGR
jgi:hypothetical protein